MTGCERYGTDYVRGYHMSVGGKISPRGWRNGRANGKGRQTGGRGEVEKDTTSRAGVCDEQAGALALGWKIHHKRMPDWMELCVGSVG